MNSWHSPQSIYSIGHRAVTDLFNFEVQIQEKIDGSFFAFGLYPEDLSDESSPLSLRVRSKGAVMEASAPMAMFKLPVQAAVARQHLLHPGWQYRGEALSKPKHNALAYDRVPKDNVILFDILTAEEEYLSYDALKTEADRIGLECVPQLYVGMINTPDELRRFLDTTSVLGGQPIEGVVVKPMAPLYGLDKKLLMAKLVSERFKEAHKVSWKESNPSNKDIIGKIVDAYATPARYMKAVQHLREAGQLEDSPRDIGKLLLEVQKDTGAECKEEIQKILWKYAWPHISRGLIRQLPQWYKDLLVERQFENNSSEQTNTGDVKHVESVTVAVDTDTDIVGA